MDIKSTLNLKSTVWRQFAKLLPEKGEVSYSVSGGSIAKDLCWFSVGDNTEFHTPLQVLESSLLCDAYVWEGSLQDAHNGANESPVVGIRQSGSDAVRIAYGRVRWGGMDNANTARVNV
ncbi:hypothetical protein Baya_12785 [Bagarius yarrelli]|uniref:Uncharacterized protein n=1 Tax=Bagarius yarrelli TaxID=175774 RepID=A0A556V3W3_BAGYA|nr:hypothetical protein Baya_12785 [Bagarius yarrelli]